MMLEENPKDSFLRHALALELHKIGEDLAAISELEALLKDDPGYVGSYYQLGKLLEAVDEEQKAIECYERGMAEARNTGQQRAFNELRSALEELRF